MARFKLLRGTHVHGGKKYHFKKNPIVEVPDVENSPGVPTSDLVAKFGGEKFMRLDAPPRGFMSAPYRKASLTGDNPSSAEQPNDDTPLENGDDGEFATEGPLAVETLEAMTVPQLKELAAQRSIDLGQAKTKDKIVEVLFEMTNE